MKSILASLFLLIAGAAAAQVRTPVFRESLTTETVPAQDLIGSLILRHEATSAYWTRFNGASWVVLGSPDTVARAGLGLRVAISDSGVRYVTPAALSAALSTAQVWQVAGAHTYRTDGNVSVGTSSPDPAGFGIGRRALNLVGSAPYMLVAGTAAGTDNVIGAFYFGLAPDYYTSGFEGVVQGGSNTIGMRLQTRYLGFPLYPLTMWADGRVELTEGPLWTNNITAPAAPSSGCYTYSVGNNLYRICAGESEASIVQTYRSIVVAASAQSLLYSRDYVFSGNTATWTLPAVSAGSIGAGYSITIKNRGSGNLTIATATAGNDLYFTEPASSLIVAPGEAYTLMPDGTYFNVE